ncbi:MAG: O-antigen ligase family protein [Ginsengibacter sp.]
MFAQKKPSFLQHITNWLRREFFIKTLISPAGIIFISAISIGAGYLAYLNLPIITFAITAGLAGIIILYYCLLKPLTGYYLVTLLAFFAFYPNHILNRELPLSTLVEVLLWFVFLGSFFQKRNRTENNYNSLLSTAVSIVLIIYTLFHVVEFFNPDLGRREGYFFVMRKFLVFIFIYIMAYRLIDTPLKLRYFFKFWIVMSFAAAAYGCYQQWFGYLPMEMRYIRSDPIEYQLMNQGGVLRKFSFLSDVVSFGVLSGSMAVLTLIFAINEKNKKVKYRLFFAVLIMALGMSYSGTRTTTVILPSGIALYLLMTIKSRTTLITLFVSVMIGFFIMFAPIDNPSLNRIRSTFNSNDPSLNVRDVNRHYIQPYIYAHPIGGGIATSGVPGRRFNPTHALAGYPPDSGLLQIAMEMGPIGLGLTLLFYLAILYQCIHYYFRMKNPRYKLYAVGIAATLFSIMITQYAQVSIGQIPGVFFFMSTISLIKRIKEFDEKEQSSWPVEQSQDKFVLS